MSAKMKFLFYSPVFFKCSGIFLWIALCTYIFITSRYGSYDVINQFLSARTLKDRILTNRPPDSHQANFSMLNREFFNYMANCLRNSAYPGVENYTRYAVARLNLAPLISMEPLIPEFGPVINDVTSFRYPIAIPQCRHFGKIRNIFIAIISAPSYFEKREMVRKTWARHLQSYSNLFTVVGFAFIFGRTKNNSTQYMIEEESRTHGDIIQIEMADSYRNLTRKVTALLNWVHLNCAKVDFVLKVDDDVYVNVHNLFLFVQNYYHESNNTLFAGKFNDYPPHRGIINRSKLHLIKFCKVKYD